MKGSMKKSIAQQTSPGYRHSPTRHDCHHSSIQYANSGPTTDAHCRIHTHMWQNRQRRKQRIDPNRNRQHNQVPRTATTPNRPTALSIPRVSSSTSMATPSEPSYDTSRRRYSQHTTTPRHTRPDQTQNPHLLPRPLPLTNYKNDSASDTRSENWNQ